MKIDNLIRQHKDIFDEINYISHIINKRDIEPDLSDLTLHINKLAGKLQIHLSSEDKFLYPNLLNGQDQQLKNMANSYINEMGGISGTFTEYKNKFNTKTKIISAGIDNFVVETKKLLSAIETRIQKEENGLYKLIIDTTN